MTKEQEALKLALEALENGMKFVWTDPEREAGFVAIDAIKEALAQPAQEPVSHEFQDKEGKWHPFIDRKHYLNTLEDGRWPIRALYTTPPQPEQKPVAWEQFHEHLVEANFCPRCGKRLASGFVEISIHKCTPPKDAR